VLILTVALVQWLISIRGFCITFVSPRQSLTQTAMSLRGKATLEIIQPIDFISRSKEFNDSGSLDAPVIPSGGVEITWDEIDCRDWNLTWNLPRFRRSLRLFKEVDRLLGLAMIEYAIAFGTALGFVRHASFIPWDDDVDIVVHEDVREDIIELFENNTAYCTLSCGWTCSLKIFFCDGPKVPKWNWTYPYIDVFLATAEYRDYDPSEGGYDNNIYRESSEYISKSPSRRKEMGFHSDESKENSNTLDDKSLNDQESNSEGFEITSMDIAFEQRLEKDLDHDDANSLYFQNYHGVIEGFYGNQLANAEDECIKEQIMFPPKRVKFAGISISAPHDIHTHLKIMYGDHYRETCKANSYNHAQESLKANVGHEAFESCESVLRNCSDIYKDFFRWTLQ